MFHENSKMIMPDGSSISGKEANKIWKERNELIDIPFLGPLAGESGIPRYTPHGKVYSSISACAALRTAMYKNYSNRGELDDRCYNVSTFNLARNIMEYVYEEDFDEDTCRRQLEKALKILADGGNDRIIHEYKRLLERPFEIVQKTIVLDVMMNKRTKV